MPTGVSATPEYINQRLVETGNNRFVDLLHYAGSMQNKSTWRYKIEPAIGVVFERRADHILRGKFVCPPGNKGWGRARTNEQGVRDRLKKEQPLIGLIYYAGKMIDTSSEWIELDTGRRFKRAARKIFNHTTVTHPDDLSLSIEEIVARLTKMRPHLRLVQKASNIHKKSLFYDIDYGYFERPIADILDKKTKMPGHPKRERVSYHAIPPDVIATLVNTRQPHVTLLKYGGTTGAQSTWLDAEYGEFTRPANHMLYGAIYPSGHPNRLKAKNLKVHTVYPHLKAYCIEHDINYVHMCYLLRNEPIKEGEVYPDWYDRCRKLRQDGTRIERIVRDLLVKHDVKFQRGKQFRKEQKIFPDFRIDSHKLIIEVDGLRYHSDRIKTRSYHAKRRKLYNKHGYLLLAFTDYQIYRQWPIIESMILAKLGKADRIFARKCKLVTLTAPQAAAFFEANHIKGKGTGRCLALEFNGEIVAALRYTKNDRGDGIKIDRYANKLNTLVVGGYTKLLSQIKDRPIISFVDCRYGDGHSLIKAGFKLVKTHIGFEWTDDGHIYSRRDYLGNSGYAKGLYKLFDYGQMKFILE